MRSSYKEKDVILLLKDITGMVDPQPAQERERLIQSGRHYCEMLPLEYVPTEKYMQVYREALEKYAGPVACAVGRLSEKIIEKRGTSAVLVSLARAGIPVGILLKHFIEKYYHLQIPHYAISIIRGRGIDHQAMKYLLQRYRPEQLLFVDGWIGKGAILGELEKEMQQYPGVSPELAVVADPAGVTELCGTHEDILIPSSCLNCTVSGLISRTFLREDIIGKDDFNGAVYYGELSDADLSYDFIHAIEAHFEEGERGSRRLDGYTEADAGCVCLSAKEQEDRTTKGFGVDEVKEIAEYFGISDINLVKPGIGETTRVLLRRVPWRILIDDAYREDDELAHIRRLAAEKQVPVMYYPLKHYKCCGIIKRMADT